MARSNVVDLNQLKPARTAKGKSAYDWERQDRSARSGVTTAHLGDIATPLEEFLRGSEAIVGCVAWITSRRLVAALAGTPVSIIVNKEWNLRATDTKPQSVSHRELFAELSGGLRRSDFPAPLNQVAGAPDDTIDAVRCAGHIGRGQMNSPLMHHKFVVRLHGGKPVAVWTGSFNFTRNAESSWENAIEMHDPVIAAAYLAEWARVAALSEPMDFTAGRADPTWSSPRSAAASNTDVAPARTTDRPVRRRPTARGAGATAPAKKQAVKTPAKRGAAAAQPRAAAKAKPRVAAVKPRQAAKPKTAASPKTSGKRAARPARARQKTGRPS